MPGATWRCSCSPVDPQRRGRGRSGGRGGQPQLAEMGSRRCLLISATALAAVPRCMMKCCTLLLTETNDFWHRQCVRGSRLRQAALLALVPVVTCALAHLPHPDHKALCFSYTTSGLRSCCTPALKWLAFALPRPSARFWALPRTSSCVGRARLCVWAILGLASRVEHAEGTDVRLHTAEEAAQDCLPSFRLCIVVGPIPDVLFIRATVQTAMHPHLVVGLCPVSLTI